MDVHGFQVRSSPSPLKGTLFSFISWAESRIEVNLLFANMFAINCKGVFCNKDSYLSRVYATKIIYTFDINGRGVPNRGGGSGQEAELSHAEIFDLMEI